MISDNVGALVVVILLVLFVIIMHGPHIDEHNSIYANEVSVICGLKMLRAQEAIWQQADIDGNGVKDFWTLDVASLNRFYKKDGKTKANLIDISLAKADGAVFSRYFPKPFDLGNETGLDLEDWGSAIALDVLTATARSGYRFQAMLFDENGVPYNQNPVGKNGIKACNNDKFAFVAYPDVYRFSGLNTFIINDADIVYQIDSGSDTNKIVLKWPGKCPGVCNGPGGKTWAPAE